MLDIANPNKTTIENIADTKATLPQILKYLDDMLVTYKKRPNTKKVLIKLRSRLAGEGGEELLSLPWAFTYKNYKGEIANRQALPLTFWYGRNTWHPGKAQWFLWAQDLDRSEKRDFAVGDILSINI